MNRRLDKFISLLVSDSCGAAILVCPENIRYLTGYTGEGCVFVDAAGAVIITDFRYTEQAGRQAPDCVCLMTTLEMDQAATLADLIASHGCGCVAFEDDRVTVRQKAAWGKAMPAVDFVPLNGLPETLRMIKDDDEIACIVRASEIACKAIENVLSMIRPGVSEREVQLALDYEMLRSGSEALAFDTIACAGKNGALPHATPSDYRIQNGDFITLDFGAQVNGYKTDMTRTFAVGRPSEEMTRVYETVLEAQARALDMIAPGVCCRDVDLCAREFIDEKYPGAFGHSLGHSVGLFIHEAPSFSRRCDTLLQPGHVLTVEPGIYLPGKFGCRIEDTIVIKEDGYIDLITVPRELTVL